MQPRDEAPDLRGIQVAQRRLFLQLEQQVERTRIVRERMRREASLVLKRFEPGFAELGVVHGLGQVRAASAPAVSSPMRRR